MIRLLFVCLGNICRSPMCELYMKDAVRRAGLQDRFLIESAATSSEELGNPVYMPAQRKLREHGISSAGKTARQITKCDYARFDFIIGMEEANRRSMLRFFGGDPDGKISLLLDWTGRPGPVADPWYSGDFDATWRDVSEACDAILRRLAGDAV